MPWDAVRPIHRPGDLGVAGVALWQFLVSALLLRGLLLVLLGTVVLGLLVPGLAPASAAGGSADLRAVPDLLHGVSSATQSLLGWPLLRAVLALLALAILLRLLQQLAPGWWLPAGRGGERAQVRLAGGAVLEAQGVPTPGVLTDSRLPVALRAAGVRVLAARRAGTVTCLVVDRAGAPARLRLLAPLGALLLIAAAFVHWRLAWVGPEVSLGVGEAGVLAPGVRATLDRVETTAGPDGAPALRRAVVSVSPSGAEPTAVTLAAGRLARVDGLQVVLAGYGPAMRIEARGEDGAPLALRPLVGSAAPGPAVQVRFGSTQQEQHVLAPEADLLVRLVHYDSLPSAGVEGPVVLAQALKASEERLLAEVLASGEATLAADGVEVRLMPEVYLRVRAERQSAWPLALGGVAFLLVGGVASVLAPQGRVWLLEDVHAAPGAVELVASGGRGAREVLARLVQGLAPEDGG